MKNRKMIARVMAGLLAVLMIGGVCMQLFSIIASAAAYQPTNAAIDSMKYTNGDSVSNLKDGKIVDVEISYTHVNSPFDNTSGTGDIGKSFTTSDTTLINKMLGSSFRAVNSFSGSTSLSITVDSMDGTSAYMLVSLKHVKYQRAKRLLLEGVTTDNTAITIGSITNYEFSINPEIPEDAFRGSSGGGGGSTDSDDGDETFTSDIVIESVFARDKNGAIIREVTKDTAPFTLDIVYTDRGFRAEHEDEFSDDTLFAYITDAGDFIPQGTNRGTLKRTASSDGDPPRFRVSFDNLKYAGATANFAKLDFRVQYLVYGENVSGTGSARLYSVESDGDGTESETAPPTPYIIINQYDLGAEQIEAGNTFTLSLNFANTSSDLALENIMMVVNPVSTEQQQSFLSIASATNTYYYNSLPAGGALSQNVDILVKASATVGSQAISVDFKYEYLVDKKRESGTTSTTIYIPITQIDRFTVDPITDFSEWMQVGEEGYVTVSFVNRGKSPTYNVTGYLLDSEGNQGQTEHFGNLEAGANGTLDFTLMPEMPGDYEGNIIVRYEDENGEDKEVPISFTAFVEEPWYPDPTDPGMIDPGMMEPEEPSTPWWKYLLFAAGGLAIAVPIALYLAKRVMAKGREEMDEDF